MATDDTDKMTRRSPSWELCLLKQADGCGIWVDEGRKWNSQSIKYSI